MSIVRRAAGDAASVSGIRWNYRERIQGNDRLCRWILARLVLGRSDRHDPLRWPYMLESAVSDMSNTTDYQKLSRGECPACGFESNLWTSREDGGHDVVLGCNNCKIEFGVQLAPFCLVERL
jgi:hypothetical protein